MTRVAATKVVDASELAAIVRPRQGLIAEQEGSRSGDFTQAEGPLRRYHRSVTVAAGPGPARWHVEQEVAFEIGLPFVSWLFAWPLRAVLGSVSPSPGNALPWWAPPARLPRRAAVNLATLCALGVLSGYLAGLLPDTMTYAASDFGVGRTGQGVALGVVQVGAVLALGLLVVADRRGRRKLILAAAAGAVVLSAAGAAAPSLWALTAAQVAAGACISAFTVGLGVVAVEEMPAGSRAWGIGVIAMSFGLGGGVTLVALPLAGVGSDGWRWLFALSLLGLPWLARCAQTLTETARFEAGKGGAVAPSGRLDPRYRRRLVILGTGALLLALFSTPAAQFENEYLRHERHLSALSISLFQQVVGTVGGLGTIVGARLADTRGRRPVAAVAILAGTATAVATYLSGGALLWIWATVSSWCSYAAAPVLGVYGGELFPTAARGRAGGMLTILASAGGLLGLVATGVLSSAIGTIGPALGILAVSQVALVVLILWSYPETAGVELEDLYLAGP
ncbi:MAG: MFS transporter [Acidimicrobiales bacterium]